MNIHKKELILGGICILANHTTFELSEREIEKKASLKRGALYELFSSKKEFVDHCFFYILDEVLKSNAKHLKLKTKEVPIKERSRSIWFNTIAWWLGHPEMYSFYIKYITSKYYYENEILKGENRKPYFSLGQEALDAGVVKPLPLEFLHELIVAQMLNTLNYINKNPKLSADSEFLSLSFEALWDSLSVIKNTD
jgi:AcrR family transcriptional regulator